MANLSQQKRERMIEFLKQLKALHTDDNSLIALNEIENEILSKKYGLVWEQHDEQVDIMMRENVPVFSEVAEREIIEEHCNDKYNFLLEGDNLHSLKLLEKTHRGGIDVIYIDPPYNTGSKDFIYNDAIVDSNDGFKHSKWLSFISERLELAKNLLKPTGMIMISINEIELYSLKLLCDSIFGDDNFLANMIWQSTPGSNTGLDIKTVTEYVLCYAKDKSKVLTASRDNIDTSKYNLKDEYAERRGGYVLNKLDRRMTGQHYSDALNYQIEMPDEKEDAFNANADFSDVKKAFLKVNRDKTCVANISKVKYLGYSFYRYRGKSRFRVHSKSIAKMKDKIRELTNRSNGWGNEYRALKLTQFIRGWVNYFGMADMKSILSQTDEWLRHKIRAIYWKQWKKVKTRFKELKKLGVEKEKAWICANMRNGNWYCSGYFVLQTAFNNKKLRELGYPTFTEYYLKICEN